MKFSKAIWILLATSGCLNCGGVEVVEVTKVDKCLVVPGFMHTARGCAYRWDIFPIGVNLDIDDAATKQAATVALRQIMDKSKCEVFVTGTDITVQDRAESGGGCALNPRGEIIKSGGISIGVGMGHSTTVAIATHEFLHALAFGHSANTLDVMAPRVHPTARISEDQAALVRDVYCGNFFD